MRATQGRLFWPLAVAVCILAFYFVANSQTFQSCVTPIKDPHAEMQRRASETQKSHIVEGISDYERCAIKFVVDQNATITALSTLLLAFITVGLVLVGREQSVTVRAQLRAYVFVADVEIKGIGTPKVEAAILIRNTGQTPAYDVTMSTAARAFNVPGEIAFAPTPVGPDSSRFVFGPDGLGRRNIPLHTLIGEPGAIAALRAGNGILYVHGEILYKDAFGAARHTRFRHAIGGANLWPEDNKMTVCPEGNEAN